MEHTGMTIASMGLLLIALIVGVAWILFPLLVLDRMNRILKALEKANEHAERTAWYTEENARVSAARTQPQVDEQQSS